MKKYSVFLSLVVSIFFYTCRNEEDSTAKIVEGVVGTTIFYSGSTYFIKGDLTTIDSLIIKPGAIVKIEGVLKVNYISAIGTEVNPIVFTSIYDNSVGETIEGTNSAHLQRGNWDCIWIEDEADFKYCEVKYSQKGICLYGNLNTIRISHCEFHDNGSADDGYAIYGNWIESAKSVKVENCTFYKNFIPMYITSHFEIDSTNLFSKDGKNNDVNALYINNNHRCIDRDTFKIKTLGVSYIVGDLDSKYILIEPGVEIYMFNTIRAECILAVGNSENNIFFGPATDNPMVILSGFSLYKTYPKYEWGGITIERGSPNESRKLSVLKYCNFEKMSNSLTKYISYSGIKASNDIEIENCRFIDCQTSVIGIPSGTINLRNVQNENVLKNNVFLNCNIPVTIESDLYFDLDNSNKFISDFHFSNMAYGIYFTEYPNVIGDRSISVSDVPLVFYHNLFIKPGNSLSLNNCVLKFGSESQLEYDGSNLTMQNDVIYTSFADDYWGDTNDDDNLTAPGDCDWKGIFNTTSGEYCDWTNIKYAKCN